jgi:uncharacterized membrane protein YedE/YeeE
MGPLIPNGIISPEWNLLVAFIIGIAFGFILEQAGFSSSRKLVGVFYGYDFVVLRVFFTAAITAAIGLTLFNQFGWINLSAIYINPTFVSSAIIGGIIMGLGFIIGGFCPGTSVCAASIGRIDAMIFILGIIIGIFLFGVSFPWFENLYIKNDLGRILVFDSLGISRDLFILILTVVAFAAFIITSRIEKKVKKVEY